MEDTLSKFFKKKAEENSEKTVLLSKDAKGIFQPITWKKLYSLSSRFGAGLINLGVKKDDHIGLISDNRKEWMIADLGILGIGCSDVPRGSDSSGNEIEYILKHADCTICLVEDGQQLEKVISITDSLPLLKHIIVIDSRFQKTESEINGIAILTFEEVLTEGSRSLEKSPACFEERIRMSQPSDLATIIYTSGTTGEPKGVMLTHSNYIHQIKAPLKPLDIRPGDVFLSVLPIWHSFERAVEYTAIFAGCSLAYSSPISQVLREDMVKVRPTIIPAVPRLWERFRESVYKNVKDEGGLKVHLFNFFVAVGTVHSKLLTMLRGLKPQFKRRIRLLDILVSFLPLILLTPLKLLGNVLVFRLIREKLGGRFKFGVSGGGALPSYVDDFFAAAGILLVEGYGLTEAAPIVSVRNSRHPVPDTIGPPLPEVEVRVVDEEGRSLPPGQRGVLFVRGPNVMKGYYKKPEETSRAILKDGWLDTGDLAMLTHRGEIKILGRAKETIVLLGGENVEPEPIEDVIKESYFIDQVMIIGQDQKYLAALVIPNHESVAEYAKDYSITYGDIDDLIKNEIIYRLLMTEIDSRINPKRGFKLFERINRAFIISKPFEPGCEMTHSLKLKRNVIVDIYKKEISGLFNTS